MCNGNLHVAKVTGSPLGMQPAQNLTILEVCVGGLEIILAHLVKPA
jgi:hypothetical protein